MTTIISLFTPKRRQQTPQEPTSPNANYGTGIPRIYGTAIVGGIVIDSTPPAEARRGGKGGGGGKGARDPMFGTIQVLLGEGERYWNQFLTTSGTGKLRLDQIYFNDELWYDSADTSNENTSRTQYFTFYDGSLDQLQDPTFVDLRGADRTPGLQGFSHIDFSDLPLQDFGNNYPSMRFKLTADIPATPLEIIRDIMTRTGIKKGRPLIEGNDWAFGLEVQSGAGFLLTEDAFPRISIEGYTITFDSIELRQELANLSQIFRFGINCTHTHGKAFTFYNNTVHSSVIHPLYAVTTVFPQDSVVLAQTTVGASDNLEVLPWEVVPEDNAATDVPDNVEIQYSNLSKTGERENELFTNDASLSGSNFTLNTNISLATDNRVPYRIAAFAAFQAFIRNRRVTTRNGLNLDGLKLKSSVNYGSAFSPIVQSLVPEALTLANTGMWEYENVYLPQNPASYNVDLVSDGLDFNVPLALEGAPDIIWVEGAALTESLTGNRNTVAVWLSPQQGRTSAEDSNVIFSTDGGASFSNTTITGVTTNAQTLVIDDYVFSPNLQDRTDIIDYEGTITVTVPDFIELISIPVEEVYDFRRNLLYIEGVGFVAFQNATLVNENQYTLSGLYFNSLNSFIDEDDTTGTFIGELAWLLLDNPYEWNLPSSVVEGDTLELAAITTDLVQGTSDIDTFRRLNSVPRQPLNVRPFAQENGDILVTWQRGIAQTSLDAPALFEDTVLDETERYNVEIFNGGTLVVDTIVNGVREYTYPQAQQATDGITNPSQLTYRITQIGSQGQIEITSGRQLINAYGRIS